MDAVITSFLKRDHIRVCVEKRVEAFEKGYRQNLAFLGPEGVGKTHLLTSLFGQFSGRPSFIPIYVNAAALDAEQLVDRWGGALFAGIFLSQSVIPPTTLQSLLSAADPIVPKTTEKFRMLKKAMRREHGSAWVRDLFALTNTLSDETGKKIILMLDEFQSLEKLPGTDPFVLLGKAMMVEKNTLYLVSSSESEKAEDIFREKLSLLFGNFEVIRLEALEFDETIRFLETRLSEYRFSLPQQKFLIRMTEGHPVYLEALAESIETCAQASHQEEFALNRPVQNEIMTEWVRRAFYREVISPKGKLFGMFQSKLESCRHMTKDAAFMVRLLLAMSHGRKKVVAIAAAIEKKSGETKKLLQRLVQARMIVRRGSFYGLEDPLFQFWLREVYERRAQLFMPDEFLATREADQILRRYLEDDELDEVMGLGNRVEVLFKEFRNDSVTIDQKKVLCPAFSEIVLHPSQGHGLMIAARGSKARWLCCVAEELFTEENVAFFIDEAKRLKKKSQHRILIALGGMDQNARLMAQQAKIQILNLQDFNTLLGLYDLPKMILLKKEDHGEALGALAQSVHTA